jgi:hypothetical protein
MGTFESSDGERYSKPNIDANIRVAKSEFVYENLDKQYCWACGKSGDRRLSISHIVSVNQCQNDAMCNVAWEKENFQLECLNGCHQQTETRTWGHHANFFYKREYLKKYERRKKRLGK